MKLVVEELKTEVLTHFEVNSITQVVAIRPHLYRHGIPSGSLYLELHSENGLIATSELIPISSIGSQNYFHGLVRFYIAKQLKPGVQYTIKLKGDGYTFSEGSYIGWVLDHDRTGYPTDSTIPLVAPFKFELWARKNI